MRRQEFYCVYIYSIKLVVLKFKKVNTLRSRINNTEAVKKHCLVLVDELLGAMKYLKT